MAYAIGHIIYGMNIAAPSPYVTTPDPFAAQRDEIYQHVNGREDPKSTAGYTEPTPGFNSAYSGSGEQPEWFGVTLGTIDECNPITGAQLIALCTPTQDHLDQYSTMVAEMAGNPNITADLRVALLATTPEVHVLWGSS